MNNLTLYNYNKNTGEFKIPSISSYSYSEKNLLESVNIGYFGFGTPVKLGTYEKSKPYYYDFYTDY